MKGSKYMPINFIRRPSAAQRVLQFVRRQLNLQGLSVESIESQTLEALKESLQRVEKFLDSPESFEGLRLKYAPSLGYYLYRERLVISFDGVLRPLLKNRRNLIIGRLEASYLDEGIQCLTESIKETNDERLTQKIEGLKVNSQSLEERLIEGSKEQERLQLQVERERASLFESRFKLFLALLDREAAATLIGIFFLVITLPIWIAEMFTSATAPSVLKNGSFLILGYFFGQATTQSSR